MTEEKIQDASEEAEDMGERSSCSGKHRTSVYKDELKKLRDEAAKAAEYLEDVRRVQAEFANFRKRWEREKQAIMHFAEEELVGELLTTIDNFERAISAAKEAGQEGPLLEGIAMVHDQLMETLKRRGLERIKTTGCEFDPNLHEAVAQLITDAAPDNHVLDELQPGYKFRDRLLRPAKVRVARAGH